MRIVVGLGNPGDRYRRTRHNVGFDVLDELVARNGNPVPRSKFDALIADIMVGPEKVLLVWPQTFMNLSGQAVQPLLAFHQAALTDLLVVCDDLNLDLGRLRFRANGSAGGQKGLADIIRRLGSEEFPRLRLGIDRPPPRMDAADYVLGKFSPHQVDTIRDAAMRAADAVEFWVREGTTAASNRYNAAEPDGKRPLGSKPQKPARDSD